MTDSTDNAAYWMELAKKSQQYEAYHRQRADIALKALTDIEEAQCAFSMPRIAKEARQKIEALNN